jgi:hypothetical protein
MRRADRDTSNPLAAGAVNLPVAAIFGSVATISTTPEPHQHAQGATGAQTATGSKLIEEPTMPKSIKTAGPLPPA